MLYDVGELISLCCQARHCELCHFLTNNSPQKNPKKIMKKTYILTSMLALAMAGSVQAAMTAGQTVGIDFGPIAPTNNFNQADGVLGSIAAGSLIDITGGATTVTSFAWSTTSNTRFSNADPNATAQGGEPVVFDDSNLDDFFGGVGGNQLITLTFSGLDAGLTYDLLIGNSFSSAVPTSTYTALNQSVVKSATNDPTIGSAAFVSLDGLSADINGDLVITVTNGGETATVVSALTLTAAIPEPGTYALLAGALALTSVMVRRRR